MKGLLSKIIFLGWVGCFLLAVAEGKNNPPPQDPPPEKPADYFPLKAGKVTLEAYLSLPVSLFKTPKGAIILLPAPNTSPDDPILIAPLRHQLADLGWLTLSIGIPTQGKAKESDATIDPVTSINAGMDAVAKEKPPIIIVLTLGEASIFMLNQLLANPSEKTIKGWVMVSGVFPEDEKDPWEKRLPKVPIPLLDVLGSFDYEKVLSQAKKRRRLKFENPFDQIFIEGASHDYNALVDVLALRIHGWILKRVVG